jgi:H+/Cl- antiporter ClcA
MIKKVFTQYWLVLLGVVIGALGGFLYWLYIGCSSGSCPITSSPFLSSLWGAVMGGLLFSIFKREEKSNE